MLCFLFASILPALCANELPEARMDTVQIIAYNGYPVQQVKVTTEDGYVLTMHRIPYGRYESKEKLHSPGRPVVFLQHGLLATSADFVLNRPEQSLGFMLADAGFDVWMGNVRGNIYSRGHINLTIDDHAYWQFSWDEMVRYDLVSMVAKALNESGRPWLYYVGYSQGTMMMFAKLSERDPAFTPKIKKFFALAPVATVKSARGALTYIGRELLPEIELLIRLIGEDQFLPSNIFSQFLARVVCGHSFTNPLCANILFQIVGPNTNQMNTTRLSVYLAHTPAGTSTQNIIHWAQMTKSGLTQMYEYPTERENMQHYGQATPPVYNVSQVNVPTRLFYSDDDWLADEQDIQTLLGTLPADILEKDSVKLDDFNHIDFIYGLRAAREIYAPIIKEMKEFERNVVRAR